LHSVGAISVYLFIVWGQYQYILYSVGAIPVYPVYLAECGGNISISCIVCRTIPVYLVECGILPVYLVECGIIPVYLSGIISVYLVECGIIPVYLVECGGNTSISCKVLNNTSTSCIMWGQYQYIL
jgi:hypothetical protein